MNKAANKYVNLLLLLIIAGAAWMRVTAYGSLYLSVGMLDTESYIDSSRTATSWENAFTGRRLFTMNLLYKLVENGDTCKLTSSSNPDAGEEGVREIQPCFNKIVFLQNALSIFAWCLLAWAAGRRIKAVPYKIIITVLILMFGFTPQIAEWDSVLSSESLSLSLFAIILVILQEIIFQTTEAHKKNVPVKVKILIAFWMFIFAVWLFIRDVHIYAALLTLIFLAPFLLIKEARKITTAIIVALAILFGHANYTSKLSPRWQPSLEHAMDYYVFPYPSRTEFFFERGMPKDTKSREYKKWVNDQGIKTYGLFLISHPGFILTNTLENSAYFKSDFIQPHFKSPENPYRSMLITIGEIVHPETNAIYIIDLILLISLCAAAIKHRDKKSIAWAWLAAWMLAYSAISLFISFYGDIDGTRRHIFPSVETFRLFLWIFLAVQADQILEKRENASIPRNV